MNILLTGGARSGKSSYAQELAERSGKRVLFVATAEAGDDEMRERIEKHKQDRPADWRTLETPTGVGKAIRDNLGDAEVVLIDCITLLVGNILGRYCDETGERIDTHSAEAAVREEILSLTERFSAHGPDFIIVTNEVGLGLVPDNPMGRVYRDLLGMANRMLAEKADEVYLLVSGLPMKLKLP